MERRNCLALWISTREDVTTMQTMMGCRYCGAVSDWGVCDDCDRAHEEQWNRYRMRPVVVPVPVIALPPAGELMRIGDVSHVVTDSYLRDGYPVVYVRKVVR